MGTFGECAREHELPIYSSSTRHQWHALRALGLAKFHQVPEIHRVLERRSCRWPRADAVVAPAPACDILLTRMSQAVTLHLSGACAAIYTFMTYSNCMCSNLYSRISHQARQHSLTHFVSISQFTNHRVYECLSGIMIHLPCSPLPHISHPFPDIEPSDIQLIVVLGVTETPCGHDVPEYTPIPAIVSWS